MHDSSLKCQALMRNNFVYDVLYLNRMLMNIHLEFHLTTSNSLTDSLCHWCTAWLYYRLDISAKRAGSHTLHSTYPIPKPFVFAGPNT